jgi:hypothetical protein
VTLKNNLFYNTGSDDYGMMCLVNNVAGVSTHSNNLYFRSASVNFTKIKEGSSYKQTPSQVLTWEGAAIVSDPLFVTPGTDFHLKTGSPAIGAGVTIAGITKDIDGVTYSNPPDIGCYQSLVNLPCPVYICSAVTEATPNIIEITYDLSLANIVPAVTAFNVKVNSVDRPLNSVSITGGVVKLTLASPIISGEITTVSYTKPATNPLQSISGGQAANISAQPVTNNLITAVPEIATASPEIKMTIYPNPVHHILNISFEYSGTYSMQDAAASANSIRIVDMSGKLVFERRLEPHSTNQLIPINLTSGVFMVLLISKGVSLSSQKLIVYN